MTSSRVLNAKFSYLADGSKVRVYDVGNNGFDYLDSLTYKNSSVGIQLEPTNCGNGMIGVNILNRFLLEIFRIFVYINQ